MYTYIELLDIELYLKLKKGGLLLTISIFFPSLLFQKSLFPPSMGIHNYLPYVDC